MRLPQLGGPRPPVPPPLPAFPPAAGPGHATVPDRERRSIEAALRARLEGEVRFDDGSRALYATDGSNYRQVPLGVVVPRSLTDVVRTIAACREHGAPVLSRGGGTSLAGQCCNVAVVIDWSKYLHHVLEVDPARKVARVQPGCVLDDLRRQAERHRLTFGPDPSTHTHCTLGGMIGNNSCGVHAQAWGRTEEQVRTLEILTYDGLRLKVGPTSDEEYARIVAAGGRRGALYRQLRELRDRYADEIRARYPKIPRRVSGYSLDALLPENGFDVARALVGSEGTCVTILEAEVRLVDSPPHRVLLLLGYPTVFEAADHVPELADRFHPLGLEGIDDRLIDHSRKKHLHPRDLDRLPAGGGVLYLEFGGETAAETRARAEEAAAWARSRRDAPNVELFDDPATMRRFWEVRESGLGATARVPGERDTWEGWEDSAVPPHRIGDYLRELRALLDRFHYACALYGHFGQGCIHTRIDFDLASAPGIAKFRHFLEEASDLVLSMGGSLSGEHGDGQSRAEFLPKMFGERLVQGFREFKAIWDPAGKMNPGKVVNPYAVDQNLRLGAEFRPRQPKTHFRFPDDDGSLARASLRCVGVGKCRREEGGVMCPSYRVTREEKHSTRGRAHLLFELLAGDVLADGWRDRAVKDALDLCLACKGCKGDCPVNVDMATYKAEFYSHYYAGRLRPRAAYAMGLVMYWARLAALAPGLANFLGHTRPFSDLAKALAGIAPERRLPRFAPETFQAWTRRRPRPPATGPRVVLFPDTFNNHFFPETARAALEVLEGAGFAVEVPRERICCGRPLYDFGMIPTAKRLLRRAMDRLAPAIEAGVPIVGLEPSCVAVFRDELPELYPHDAAARQLSRQVFTFDEFLAKHADGIALPRLERAALLQGHCHAKSVLGFREAEPGLLDRLGLKAEEPEPGCCGMAGSFGFEAGDRAAVGHACGERALLPAVRRAPKTTVIVADGFSCREQIAQHTDRRALHLAQVVRLAGLQGPGGPETPYPERGWVTSGLGEPRPRSAWRAGAVAVGALAAAAWLARAAAPRRPSRRFAR
jgi:FAD/FMN-containing dehydrogenase/Fe-S oxidoreductase